MPYDKQKTTQTSGKPTRKVVATSWATAIIMLVTLLTGADLEPGLQENLTEILTAVLIAGASGIGTLGIGWLKRPAKGDQVE